MFPKQGERGINGMGNSTLFGKHLDFSGNFFIMVVCMKFKIMLWARFLRRFGLKMDMTGLTFWFQTHRCLQTYLFLFIFMQKNLKKQNMVVSPQQGIMGSLINYLEVRSVNWHGKYCIVV